MRILLAGSLQQRLRLFSGLILFTFALTHFLNHALGLVSLEAMEMAQDGRTAVTRSWLGGALLFGALLVHVSLALYRLARRSTLRMPAWELVQIASGLLIPVLLIPHIVGMRIGSAFFGTDWDYTYALAVQWPNRAIEQSLLLLLVWVHGCIGLHFWLRLWPGYRRLQPVLLALAVAVPLLGLTGFITAGREVADALREQGEAGTLDSVVRFGSEETYATLIAIYTWAVRGFLAIVASVFLVVGIRNLPRGIARRIAVRYFAGPTVQSPAGPTLLEISRRKGVPHVSVCGGRGRCSTCRVHIDETHGALEPPGTVERRTLERIGAGPGIRLACQLHPASDLAVTRLVKPGAKSARDALASAESHGAERTLTILFLDIRSFTKLTQQRLPYDVVFVLNRLFEHLGDAIRSHGGRIDKYLGDGLMASFGRESGSAIGARQALAAAKALDLALERANTEIAAELGQSLVIGMGLHAGPVVVGEIGHPSGMASDVIGETVNTAARLEALTKDEHCQIAVSAAVLELAGASLADFPRKIISVRGIDVPLSITLVPAGRRLPEISLTRPEPIEPPISAVNAG